MESLRDTVCILLASFNGEQYLDDQINSIIKQTYSNWKLLILDDHSSDKTNKIILKWSKRDARIKYLGSQERNIGAKNIFSNLMGEAIKQQENYIALADQDDVWLTNKIELLVEAIKKKEKQFSIQTPILIHSDLYIVNSELSIISNSFMKYKGYYHTNYNPLSILLSQNFVTGNTCLFNRALLQIVFPVPSECLMHDWWIALCAFATGHVGYIDRPLSLYRQHQSNLVGAKSTSIFKAIKKILQSQNNFRNSFVQARKLHERLIGLKKILKINDDNISTINNYRNIINIFYILRPFYIKKYNFRRQNYPLLLYIRALFL